MIVIYMSPGDRTDATCKNAAGVLGTHLLCKGPLNLNGNLQPKHRWWRVSAMPPPIRTRTRDLFRDKMEEAMVSRPGRKTESQNINWCWHGTFWPGAFLTTFTDLNFNLVLLLFSLRSIQIFKHQEGCGKHIQSKLLMQSSLIFCIHITLVKIVQCFTL